MMDKVKKYWQNIIKEREGFWSSLFCKYEEDKKDVDLGSYMEDSFSRISTLLQLAVEDEKDEASENLCGKMTTNPEEQLCESSDATISFNGDINQEAKEKELENLNHPVASVKKPEPLFVVEILAEEEEEKWNSILHSTKKLKLVDYSVKFEDAIDDSTASDYTENSTESPVAESLNDSIAVNTSMQSESKRYVCRRVKSGSAQAPSPKRFKLA